ncbi:L-seryl-tRNA(Sec) selenium transferase [Rubripirellula tenax]|uniref:L-seryl-tRNA(Sec) selenium transferase n=1 Tax=Rubripirellula tenax TaxID=2528015 RepID=A0A5C6EJP8_9BACT|nr:hypothetical protein [Rubripirellula tenax]TWU48774.1 L-seryl-tRNA(Sec) selenium transferase [Rubripirellula tenax]
MAIPPWTVDLIRRGLSDVARKASQPETIERLKNQAGEILQDLPQTAARGIDAVMRSAESGKKSVQRWTRKHTTLAIPMLNATGVLCDASGTGVPLDDSILELGFELLSGDTVTDDELTQKLQRRLDRAIPGADEHSALVAHQFDAAIAAIALLASDERPVVLHRGHAIRLPSGRALPAVLADTTANRRVVEVGGINRVDVADFAGLASCVVVLADDGNRGVELFDFETLAAKSSSAGKQDAIQVVVLPVGTVRESGKAGLPSAESLLNAGADLVVVAGGPLASGPPCGVLVGRRECIQRIRHQEAWRALSAPDSVTAMMTMAIETSANTNNLIATALPTPMDRLLTTAEENLHGRAERLSTRLLGNDLIAKCEVGAAEAKITDDGRWKIPSRQLRIRHQHLSAQDWVDKLRGDVPAVFANVDGDDLVLDLRWIAAADDAKLADAISGHAVERDSVKRDAASQVSSQQMGEV